MSVLIRGMEMPKNCIVCRVVDGEYGGCLIDGKGHGDPNEPVECPLVEVPTPHGRLIDADEVIKHDHQHYEYLSDEFYITVRDVEAAPTVIEAEE